MSSELYRLRRHFKPAISEVRKNWAGWVGRRDARAWKKAGPHAVEERLNLLLEVYLERKRQLRSIGIRPNIVHGTMEVLDQERAREGLSALSFNESFNLWMGGLFVGNSWYRAAWALYRSKDLAKAAAKLAEFYDEVVMALGVVPAMEIAHRLGPAARTWTNEWSLLAGYLRGQLRTTSQPGRLPDMEEELMSFAYEAWRSTPLLSTAALRNEVVRLWDEFRSKDTESGHWSYLFEKKGEPPKRIQGIQELPPHEVLEAASALEAASDISEDEELAEFERQETLRQNSQRLKRWVERAGFSSQQRKVYEADMRNNFNIPLAAKELGMNESTYRTQRARYIAKLREISIIMMSRELANKISQNIA